MRRKYAPQYLFRLSVRIEIGGVEEIHAGVERGMDHAGSLRLVGTVAEGHGSETDFRDLQAAAA